MNMTPLPLLIMSLAIAASPSIFGPWGVLWIAGLAFLIFASNMIVSKMVSFKVLMGISKHDNFTALYLFVVEIIAGVVFLMGSFSISSITLDIPQVVVLGGIGVLLAALSMINSSKRRRM